MVALDILIPKKYEDTYDSTAIVQVPNVSHNDFQLIDFDDEDYFQLMDNDSDIFSVKTAGVNTKLLKEIKRRYESGENLLVRTFC